MPDHKSSKPYGGGRTDRPASVFLDTTGQPTLGVGICSRCNFKFPLAMLSDDPNIPNFKVCSADRDDYDPYRMPARPADKIALPFVRPDVSLETPPTPPWEE
jgi:hypothetical protein